MKKTIASKTTKVMTDNNKNDDHSNVNVDDNDEDGSTQQSWLSGRAQNSQAVDHSSRLKQH